MDRTAAIFFHQAFVSSPKAGLQHLAPGNDSTLADWWLLTRDAVPETIRRAFDSLVLLVAWVIWKERNSRTFSNVAKTTTQVIAVVTEELDAYIGAGYRRLASLFVSTSNGRKQCLTFSTTA